jgi:transcriptional regulator with XRE-family HTH domain
VRAARKDQGLTLTGFAASLGIHKSYLCDIEFGRRTPGPKVAGPIWMALGVRFETEREADLRLAVGQLLDAADRARHGERSRPRNGTRCADFATMLIAGGRYGRILRLCELWDAAAGRWEPAAWVAWDEDGSDSPWPLRELVLVRRGEREESEGRA